MDSLDVFIRLVNKDNSAIHKGLRLLFQCIFNGCIDACIEPYLTNTYLFYLYKDEMDLSKLQPIGVPSALWRIIINHTARSHHRKFVLDLIPSNYAIGIGSGMDFVVKASQFSVGMSSHARKSLSSSATSTPSSPHRIHAIQRDMLCFLQYR